MDDERACDSGARGGDRKVMHTRELIDEVARRTRYGHGLTRRGVREVLDELVRVITEQLSQGNAVTIVGFGRFEATEHRGRLVCGLDGKVYQIESRRVASFRAFPCLRLTLQGRRPESPEEREPSRPPWYIL